MNRKEEIEAEIEQHLSIIKELRLRLEKEEQELEICYDVLNLMKEND